MTMTSVWCENLSNEFYGKSVKTRIFNLYVENGFILLYKNLIKLKNENDIVTSII